MKHFFATLAVGLCAMVGTTQSAGAQTHAYLGQVMTTAAQFCPRNWVPMHGQLMAVSTNAALHSLLGNRYGGDNVNTFRLPDTRGRAVLDAGNSPGRMSIRQGQAGEIGGGTGDTGGALATPTLALLNCIAVRGEFPTRN
ncbi:phage tail protein [uncultured Maricaulis sp.]|uniref:phage tail protein n=1 Tax=uncultured Maricaulis sp. TaxID=174710 RepID=UPI0030DCFAFC|tara:strand:+ start:149687 stop:150106 length:420 start_codon:yes stop_codon:yes gene_type:complete